VQVDATDPPPPDDVTALTPTKLPVLSWQPASDATTGGSPIVGYRIYRDGLFAGEAATPAYTDGKLALSGQYVYTVRAIDAAGNVSAASKGFEVILDADGPILDGISFPQKTVAGASVDFSVHPRDVHSTVAGEADWDFGDGTAVGNSTKHIFEQPGRYTVTIRASDALGNITTIGDRTIQVSAPKGGLPPKKLTLGRIPTTSLKLLKRDRWKIKAAVTVDVDTTLQFLIMRRGVLVASMSRKVPAGGVVLPLTLPKAQRKTGKFQLIVRSVSASLEAKQRFTLKR
jgi:PKD repeat protein